MHAHSTDPDNDIAAQVAQVESRLATLDRERDELLSRLQELRRRLALPPGEEPDVRDG